MRRIRRNGCLRNTRTTQVGIQQPLAPPSCMSLTGSQAHLDIPRETQRYPDLFLLCIGRCLVFRLKMIPVRLSRIAERLVICDVSIDRAQPPSFRMSIDASRVRRQVCRSGRRSPIGRIVASSLASKGHQRIIGLRRYLGSRRVRSDRKSHGLP